MPYDYSTITANTSAHQVVRGDSCTVGGVWTYNGVGTLGYLDLYDAATTGAVTLGTTVPVVSIYVGTSASEENVLQTFPGGIKMDNGLTVYAATDPGAATARYLDASSCRTTIFYRG